jgi:O-antigen/teichoic acid export membrane protein
MFLLMLPIVIVYCIFAPTLFTLLFPRYIDSVHYSQLYSLTLLVSAVLPLSILEAHVAIKEKYIISLASNITKIIVITLGIFYFGILGAIIARIISKLFGISLGLFFAKRI